MKDQPIIYRVTERLGKQRPVRIREGETMPCHADMLRYDVAFHHPGDPSLVIFPTFSHRNGRYPIKITVARWDSFVLKLALFLDTNCVGDYDDKPLPEGVTSYGIQNLGDWIGYRHNPPDYSLHRVTLDEYLKLEPKTAIKSYR